MKQNWKFLATAILGALSLLLSAFYNGFPLVTADTGTYLSSGFELETPFDRPITYGLFVRLFSINGWSLWPVVFVQSLLLSSTILALFASISRNKYFLLRGLLTIVLLSLFSAASWTASQIMSDVFTPIALLSMVLILSEYFSKKQSLPLYFLFFIAVAMHMSHVLLFGVLLSIIFLFRKFILPKQQYPKAIYQIGILLLLTGASILTMGSALSKSKHVFFMGAMVEQGITKTWLEEHCADQHYKLCEFKDSLPLRAYDFVWNENSPLYKVGGWQGSKEEFTSIINGTLTEPKYIGLHLQASVKATAQQLVTFNVGDGNFPFQKGTILFERIEKYLPKDVLLFSSAKQYDDQLLIVETLNKTFPIVIVMSLLATILLMLWWRGFPDNQMLRVTGLILLLFLLLNAWDCGTFANVLGRLGSKVIWLIPLFTALIVHGGLRKRIEDTDGLKVEEL